MFAPEWPVLELDEVVTIVIAVENLMAHVTKVGATRKDLFSSLVRQFV
mgnify:CR=1 FL=1